MNENDIVGMTAYLRRRLKQNKGLAPWLKCNRRNDRTGIE